MNKVTIHYSIDDSGDGSAYISAYLKQSTMEKVIERNMTEYDCYSYGTDTLQTFEGSDIYKEAVRNEKEFHDS